MTTMKRLGLVILLASSLYFAKATQNNGRTLTTWLRSMRAKRQDDSGSDRVYTLADAIPGEPDTDYPILGEIPETDFSCVGRTPGYYADIGARCQVFRVCANTANNTAKGFAFLCPNGTLFNQEFFVCDWYRNVNCENSVNFYHLNDLIGNTMAKLPMRDVMNSAREIIMFPQQGSKLNPANGPGMFDNYPSDLGSPLGIDGVRKPGSRGSSNLGQPNGSGKPSGNGKPSSASGVNPPRFGSPSSSKTSPGSSSGSPGGLSGFPGGSPSLSSGSANPSGLPVSPNRLGTSGSAGGLPSRGSTNGSPVSGSQRPSVSGSPGSLGGPGLNDGTVYVNSLGQLSTEKDSGFDPKQSFILKPDADSTFDPLKGIDNSYSFGFPGDSTAPTRGSEDLSEPVDPSALGLDQFSPTLNGQNPKQIYTYPHDAEAQNQPGIEGILPEHTGRLNTQLAAQGPSYQAPQVYGPPIPSGQVTPQKTYHQPNSQSATPSGFQKPNGQSAPPSAIQQPKTQQQNSYNRPSSNQGAIKQSFSSQPGNGQGTSFGSQPGNNQESRFGSQPGGGLSSSQSPAQQPQRLYQKPAKQTLGNQPGSGQNLGNNQSQGQSFGNQQGSGNGQPNRLYQQPRAQQSLNSNSKQPQPFSVRNQQAERRQFNVPQRDNNQQQSNGFINGSNRNGQSNEEYLRNFLKDKTHIHHNKSQLVELIERLFVPPTSRVVSAEVIPSPARESYSFIYNEGSASSVNSNYQQAPSGHQHSGLCRHQGYIY